MKHRVNVVLESGKIQYQIYDNLEEAEQKVKEIEDMTSQCRMVWVSKCLVNTRFITYAYISDLPDYIENIGER